jgi:hypothetical protein
VVTDGQEAAQVRDASDPVAGTRRAGESDCGHEGQAGAPGQQTGSNRRPSGPIRPMENRGGMSERPSADICSYLRLSGDPSGSLTIRRTGRQWLVGSDTEEDGGSTPPAPTIPTRTIFLRAPVPCWARRAQRTPGERVCRCARRGCRTWPCPWLGRLGSPWRHAGATSMVCNGCRVRSGPEGEGR